MRRAKTAMELKTAYAGTFQNRVILWYRPEMDEEHVRADYANQHEQLKMA